MKSLSLVVSAFAFARQCPVVWARAKGSFPTRTTSHNSTKSGSGKSGSSKGGDRSKGSSPTPSPRSPRQGPPCNQVIGIVTKAEIERLATFWVDVIALATPLTADEREAALQVYLGGNETPKYDIVASKVCGSCAEFQKNMETADPTGAWKTYCGKDVYGYQATHSALAFHPLDPETNAPLTGIRNVGVAFQSTRITVTEAFSTDFPSNVTQRIAETLSDFNALANSFADAYPLMVAASLGLVTYGPDHIGAGESEPDYDRSYLTAVPVQQATVVGYYATAEYTKQVTDGCTAVSDQVITWGYSAGGASVVFGTLALDGQGLTIERLFSGAGPYSNAAIVQSIIGTYQAGTVLGCIQVELEPASHCDRAFSYINCIWIFYFYFLHRHCLGRSRQYCGGIRRSWFLWLCGGSILE